MRKFYVESGRNLRVVLLAHDPLDAIFKALTRTAQDEPLRLADVVIVNERGFVWDRDDHEMYGDELVLPTRLLLGPPANAR